jgi:hypothetical protein
MKVECLQAHCRGMAELNSFRWHALPHGSTAICLHSYHCSLPGHLNAEIGDVLLIFEAYGVEWIRAAKLIPKLKIGIMPASHLHTLNEPHNPWEYEGGSQLDIDEWISRIPLKSLSIAK